MRTKIRVFFVFESLKDETPLVISILGAVAVRHELRQARLVLAIVLAVLSAMVTGVLGPRAVAGWRRGRLQALGVAEAARVLRGEARAAAARLTHELGHAL